MSVVYRAYAPASAANLSVGFDLVGVALKPITGEILGDEILISEAPEGTGCRLKVTGRYARRLPPEPEKNIVYDAFLRYREIAAERGLPACDVDMELKKNLPVCSGLGSSAASVVAAVIALDAVNGGGLGGAGRMALMAELEGKISGSIHYDNIAPCCYGGLQLIVNECNIISKALPSFENWYWVSCFPGVQVSTHDAREILPKSYPRSDVVAYGRRLAAFVDACHRSDAATAAACLKDVIAEPYRAGLIPGFGAARKFGSQNGALATGISGSGSALFSLYDDLEKAQTMKAWLEDNFIANEDGFCYVCRPDRRGAYVERL